MCMNAGSKWQRSLQCFPGDFTPSNIICGVWIQPDLVMLALALTAMVVYSPTVNNPPFCLYMSLSYEYYSHKWIRVGHPLDNKEKATVCLKVQLRKTLCTYIIKHRSQKFISKYVWSLSTKHCSVKVTLWRCLSNVWSLSHEWDSTGKLTNRCLASDRYQITCHRC